MDPISSLIESGGREGVFPGAVLWVQQGDRVVYKGAWGKTSLFPGSREVSVETLYDVASLTKVMATTTGILLWLQRDLRFSIQQTPYYPSSHERSLDTPLEKVLPGFLSDEKGRLTLRHLLSHSAGFPDTRPFYQKIREEDQIRPGFMGSIQAKERIFEYIRGEPLIYAPGTKQIYSDLGFILLGEFLERVSDAPLDHLCQRGIFKPWGLSRTEFRPLHDNKPITENIAATERCPWRGKTLVGEVHDDNAYAMGGVAGHAGLFSTASDIARFAFWVLSAWKGEEGVFDSTLIREFTKKGSSEWGLGWMRRTEPSSSGRFFSDESFGHLGFTGTSLWIDPKRDLIVVFLSNRCTPHTA